MKMPKLSAKLAENEMIMEEPISYSMDCFKPSYDVYVYSTAVSVIILFVFEWRQRYTYISSAKRFESTCQGPIFSS